MRCSARQHFVAFGIGCGPVQGLRSCPHTIYAGELSHERLLWVSARLQLGTWPDIEAWRWRTDMSNELETPFAPSRMRYRNEWPQHSIQNKTLIGSFSPL